MSTGIVIQSMLLLGLVLLMKLDSWVQGYSLAEIVDDSLTINFPELAKYRGPILQDIWMSDHFQFYSHTHDRDVRTCHALYKKALETVNVTWPPPHAPPSELRDAYLMGEKAAFFDWYFAEQQNGGGGYTWDKNTFEMARAKPNTCGFYNKTYCDTIMKKHRNLLYNFTGIVVGSQSPWLEAALFNIGARKVITIEYMKITSDYPGHAALHPSEAAQSYLAKTWQPVDFAFSYSSLEHDGLGRYGDPLNPFGDLESIARIRCLLRPGGFLFFGVPVGPDAMVWNAHRIYGKYRIALTLLGWRVIDILPEDCNMKTVSNGYECQPILVLQKPFYTKH